MVARRVLQAKRNSNFGNHDFRDNRNGGRPPKSELRQSYTRKSQDLASLVESGLSLREVDPHSLDLHRHLPRHDDAGEQDRLPPAGRELPKVCTDGAMAKADLFGEAALACRLIVRA